MLASLTAGDVVFYICVYDFKEIQKDSSDLMYFCVNFFY